MKNKLLDYIKSLGYLKDSLLIEKEKHEDDIYRITCIISELKFISKKRYPRAIDLSSFILGMGVCFILFSLLG